ncbi:MAG: YybS family protein, partial [Clostridia bacterium]|nr:YybS family protein [Clostridia bacterium]
MRRRAQAEALPLRALVEGAMLAAVAAVLVLAGLFLPVVGTLVTVAWPVPVVLAYLRHGPRLAVLTALVAGGVLTLLVGVVQAVVPSVTLMAFGLALGWAIRRRLSAAAVLAASAVAAMVSLGASVAALQLFVGVDFLASLTESLEQALRATEGLYGRMGLEEAARSASALREAFVPLLRTLFPTILLGAVATLAFANYLITGAVLARLGYQVPALPPFRQWRLPRWTVLGYAAAFALLAAGWTRPEGTLRVVGTNLYTLFGVLFLVQGLSAALFLLDRWRVPRGVAAALTIVAVFNPLLSQLLVGLGLAEVLVGYRRLLQDRVPPPAPLEDTVPATGRRQRDHLGEG